MISRVLARRALAEQSGVTRTTVRQVVRFRDGEGLVRLYMVTSGGVFVREASSDAINIGLLDMFHLAASARSSCPHRASDPQSAMIMIMNGILGVLEYATASPGQPPPTLVVPSRKRFAKHFAAGNADVAVCEMEKSLREIQRVYLSKVERDLVLPRSLMTRNNRVRN